MPTFWDPRCILDIYPNQYGFTCTGITKKGARCRNSFISNADKTEASKILDWLAERDIIVEDLNRRIGPKLVRLAELTLCPRWHRAGHLSQVDDVSLKWHLAASKFCREERRALRELRTSVTPSRVNVRHIHSSSAVVSLTRSFPHSIIANIPWRRQPRPSPETNDIPRPRTQQPHPTPVEAAAEHVLASSARAPRPEDHRSRPSPIRREPSPAPRPRAESERLNRDTTAQQEQAHRPSENGPQDIPRNPHPVIFLRQPQVIDQLPTPPQSPVRRRHQPGPRLSVAVAIPPPRTAISARAAQAQPDSPEAQQASSRPSAPVTTGRKPLSEACYVCYEAFSGPEDAVWCRNSCGQNLHRECFKQWRSGKKRRDVKCAFWYVGRLCLSLIVKLMIHIRSRAEWVYE
jgi:hypothetical protein